MKTRILTLLLVAMCSIGMVWAEQPEQQRARPRLSREELTQAKKAHLTKVLNLTQAESEQLGKVIAELDDQRFALWKELSPLHRRVARGDNTLTEQELETFLDLRLTTKIKEAELERNFYLRCKTFLSVGQVLRLEKENRRFVSKYFQSHGGPENKRK